MVPKGRNPPLALLSRLERRRKSSQIPREMRPIVIQPVLPEAKFYPSLFVISLHVEAYVHNDTQCVKMPICTPKLKSLTKKHHKPEDKRNTRTDGRIKGGQVRR